MKPRFRFMSESEEKLFLAQRRRRRIMFALFVATLIALFLVQRKVGW